MNLQQHALSKIFPPLSADELDQLALDVRDNGLLDPIVVFEDKVLDGWHRLQACLKSGIEAHIIRYEGNDPAAFVKSKNWARRHLTSSQRAHAITALNDWMERGKPLNGPNGPFGKSTGQMAKEAGVGERQVKRAKHVLKNGSDRLNDEVRTGKKSLAQAEKETRPKKATKPKKPFKAAKQPTDKQLQKDHAKLQQAFEALKALHEKTAEEFDLARVNAEALAEELQTALAQAGGDETVRKEMNALRATNRALILKRDALMNENAALKQSVAHWRKRAEKCERASARKK